MSNTLQNYINLALDAVIANPVKLREVNKESTSYLELVESIRKDGVVNPITVRETETDLGTQYQLVDGLHRLTAARDAGLESLDVQLKVLNDTEVLMMQISMNSHTIETRPVEYTQALKQILSANPFMTLAELGRDIGKSAAWIEQRLSLVNIINETIKALVNEGKITLVNAYALATLPEEEQLDWVTQAQTESIAEFGPKVSARVRELKAAARQARTAEPAGFVPVAIMRKFGDLKKAPDNAELIAKLATQAGSVEEAILVGIKYTMSLDALSVSEQETAYNDKKAAQTKAKEERAIKRNEAAAAKAAEASEGLAEDADAALG